MVWNSGLSVETEPVLVNTAIFGSASDPSLVCEGERTTVSVIGYLHTGGWTSLRHIQAIDGVEGALNICFSKAEAHSLADRRCDPLATYSAYGDSGAAIARPAGNL